MEKELSYVTITLITLGYILFLYLANKYNKRKEKYER